MQRCHLIEMRTDLSRCSDGCLAELLISIGVTEIIPVAHQLFDSVTASTLQRGHLDTWWQEISYLESGFTAMCGDGL